VISKPVDPKAFINDSYIRKVVGSTYDQQSAVETNAAAIGGTDTLCHRAVSSAALAGEIWVKGEADTRPAADPTCLLRDVKQLQASGKTIRADYVPDGLTGTRWFADRSLWLSYGSSLVPFATQDNANAYLKTHPGGRQLTWTQALGAV
jgi:NitT/TauT family transport system substrate-binding protein